MALTMTMKKTDDVPILKLQGRVIGVDSKKLEKKLEVLFHKDAKRCVMDISEIDFIDSYGLGVVVYYHTQMLKSGREFCLLNTNVNQMAYINRLLELTRLSSVFKVIRSL